jgi:transcriptional regulator with XRE-family HTH domain
MTEVTRGYTTLFVRKVEEADQSLPVIQFARLCIDRELPIVSIALRLGVTRATVYNWFTGKATPRARHIEAIRKLSKRYEAKALRRG